METFNLYLGDRLDWLDALAEAPATQQNWPSEPRLSRAGLTSVEVLPIEDFAFFRFYRLRH
jgi:hypothetical protein